MQGLNKKNQAQAKGFGSKGQRDGDMQPPSQKKTQRQRQVRGENDGEQRQQRCTAEVGESRAARGEQRYSRLRETES
ncbi:putative titin-like [Sesbania bispinosa]|nr:putative titin-like [Sesbania bispinosa]